MKGRTPPTQNPPRKRKYCRCAGIVPRTVEWMVKKGLHIVCNDCGNQVTPESLATRSVAPRAHAA